METRSAWQCSCFRTLALGLPYFLDDLREFLTPSQKQMMRYWRLLVVMIHKQQTDAYSQGWIDYFGTQFRTHYTHAVRLHGEKRGQVPWPASAQVVVRTAALTRPQIMCMRNADMKAELTTAGIRTHSSFDKKALQRALLRKHKIPLTDAELEAEALVEAAAEKKRRHVIVAHAR